MWCCVLAEVPRGVFRRVLTTLEPKKREQAWSGLSSERISGTRYDTMFWRAISCRWQGRTRCSRMLAVALLVMLSVLVSSLVAAVGCSRAPEAEQAAAAGNLLAGRRPTRAEGVRRPEVMTDGIAARTGDGWDTELTSVFRRESTFLEWDLGSVQAIRAAYLQADNNNLYLVSVSDDGSTFRPLWTAPSRSGSGLQERSTSELNGAGRYVRLSGSKGDRVYSVSEFELFSDVPSVFPPKPPVRVGLEIAERVRTQVLLFGLGLILLLASTYRNSPLLVRVLGAVFAAWTGVGLWQMCSMAWPIEQREVSIIRAVAAAVAAAAVAGESLVAERWRPNPRASLSLLWLAAIVSVASFFNLGMAQFYDHREGHPSFVHNFDMRVYYPIAKYFDELRFDGLYVGSVAAYVDDANIPLSSLASVELRDLNTHHTRRVGEVEREIKAVKARFTPERWETFKVDMRYFRETMGVDDYLGSMLDHGGNATPVWFAIAKVLFAHTDATNATLLAGALLDPLLLIAMFVTIGLTFGVRTALACAVLFGANDFYMFGSNWAGATLRHDWLAYLGIGVCLLRREKWKAAGAFLAMATMIRAFPALALMATAVPLVFWIWDYWREHKALPKVSELFARHRPVVQIAIGAAACVAVAFVLSSLLLSFGAWSAWLHKVAILDRDPHINDISLRALVAGSEANQHRVLQARLPLFVVSVALCVGAVAFAARRRSLDHAAVLGMILTAVVFNPANYYIHFVCLLPILATERLVGGGAARSAGTPEPLSPEDAGDGTEPIAPGEAVGWIVSFLMCVALYWTVLTPDKDLHFQSATAIFFGAMAILLYKTIRIGLDARAAGAAMTPAVARAEAGAGADAGGGESRVES